MDLGLPPALISATKESLAYQVIGCNLATALFGITLLQTYIYYRRYVKDSIVLKTFVAVLVCLDTSTTILTVHGLYTYVVGDYLNPLKLLDIVWSLRVENGLGVTTSFLVQCYFGQRLWILSRKNIVFTALIFLLAFSNFGAGIGLTALMQMNPSVFVFSTVKARILIGVCNGCSSLCDALIAGGLCYFLHTGRSGVKQSNRLIDKLMVYAIQRGLLTTICQILHLTTSLALPDRFIFLVFVLPENKLYTNCLLATLNIRHTLTNTNGIDLSSRCLVFNNSTASGTDVSQTYPAPIDSEANDSKAADFDLRILKSQRGRKTSEPK
ncbi:hypothetical protein PYCCODRAFT_1479940 [Trametes coccinea BRFM310]|uniref:DUF6534 domain-containing protein n=1 Tax=Trametes coccinea (strain BRFM310) TaxID=1353009 RepID=A0A1Y2IH50_TRAC3|nr:hypothetical protein PYCCODRAFT_1479940 [Trametes coccinea BRFM310]